MGATFLHTTTMDPEWGLFNDSPEFDEFIERLTNDLFKINSINGQVSELLRCGQKPSGCGHGRLSISRQQMALVQQNQLLFKRFKNDIEEMQQWRDPNVSQKYSQHKIAVDFGRLFIEFKRIQEQVLEQAKASVILKPIPYPSYLPQSTNGLDAKSKADQAESHENAQQEQPQSQRENPEEADFTARSEQVALFEEQLTKDEIAYQEGLVADREREIENIVQGMNELNEIYMDLDTIVGEQGVSLDNIEANMHYVSTYVCNGDFQLRQAYRWQRQSTGKMCHFFIIFLVLVLLIVISFVL